MSWMTSGQICTELAISKATLKKYKDLGEIESKNDIGGK